MLRFGRSSRRVIFSGLGCLALCVLCFRGEYVVIILGLYVRAVICAYWVAYRVYEQVEFACGCAVISLCLWVLEPLEVVINGGGRLFIGFGFLIRIHVCKNC